MKNSLTEVCQTWHSFLAPTHSPRPEHLESEPFPPVLLIYLSFSKAPKSTNWVTEESKRKYCFLEGGLLRAQVEADKVEAPSEFDPTEENHTPNKKWLHSPDSVSKFPNFTGMGLGDQKLECRGEITNWINPKHVQEHWPWLVHFSDQSVIPRSTYLQDDRQQAKYTYICRDPKEPPKTIILSSITQEEWPAMGGGPWVVTMQFHLIQSQEEAEKSGTIWTHGTAGN